MRYVTIDPKHWPYVVGCVSDTHVPSRTGHLPGQLLEALAGFDLILHGGDLVEEDVLVQLGLLARVEAVAGNMDSPALTRRLGRALLLRIGPWSVGLTHGDEGTAGTTLERAKEMFGSETADVVVFGHSHQPVCERRDGVLLLNPGSATDPRRAHWPSCAILTLPDPAWKGSPQADIHRLGRC